MTNLYQDCFATSKGFILFDELLKASFQDSSNKIKHHHQ